VEVNGVWYKTEKELLHVFKCCKQALHLQYATRHINDTNDANFKWMWALILGHTRGASKIQGAETFRFTRDGTIYLVDAQGEPLKDTKGKWVTVGKDGLVHNRFRTSDVQPYRTKVAKVMRELVSDQVQQVRYNAGAQGQGKQVHVGHGFDGTDPFGAMVIRFMMENGFTAPCHMEHIAIERVSANSGNFQLSAGPELEFKWKEFHRKHAVMAIQDAHQNLSNNYKDKRKLWALEEKGEVGTTTTHKHPCPMKKRN